MITLAIWGESGMTLTQALGVAAVGISVVLAELGLLAVFIKILSGIIGAFSKKKAHGGDAAAVDPSPAKSVAPAPPVSPAPAGESQGSVNLINVDEPAAACIMAIVSSRSGIPLDRLRFKSIKLLEDK